MRFDFSTIIKELQVEETDAKITVRLGKTGGGKTLVQTEKNVLPILLDGQEVWCCYWLNWALPNYHYFSPRDFDSVKNLRNCTIVFDEVARSFPARSYADESSDFLDFVQLHRHRHNDIIANTQDISLVAKTIGVQAHNWSQVEREPRHFFLKFLDKVFERDKIVIRQDYLTYGELKKIALGYELHEEVAINAEWELVTFTKEELLHRELDEFKIELVHKYCSKCKSRQGTQILKENTDNECDKVFDGKGRLIGYSLKNKEYCPKHKNIELSVRESSMFDTDYEPEPSNEVFKILRYKVCSVCGKDHLVH